MKDDNKINLSGVDRGETRADSFLSVSMAASGNLSDYGPIEVLTATPTKPFAWDLDLIRSYFLDRIGELEKDCESGAPWVFISAAVLIEYLSNLVVDPKKPDPKDSTKSLKKNDLERYLEFVNNWVPEHYRTFRYENEHPCPGGTTDQDLTLQMYCVLRSAMVHSFSMTPDSHFWSEEKRASSTALQRYARAGSIVISHARSGNTHLSNYRKTDAACLVAEDFINDIRKTISKIFEEAASDKSLADRIIGVVNARPPLQLIEKD